MTEHHFFALLSRMKLIRRWGLMRNAQPENVQEHTLRVAILAHALAVIRNRFYDGDVDEDRVATVALFHDATEVITGDLPAPIKYHTDTLRDAYRAIEEDAALTLLDLLPEELQTDYRELILPDEVDGDLTEIVKAADKLCAYLKCLEERSAGNPEFAKAEETLRASVESIDLPEVRYFLDRFAGSFELTLDELSR